MKAIIRIVTLILLLPIAGRHAWKLGKSSTARGFDPRYELDAWVEDMQYESYVYFQAIIDVLR